MNDDCERIAQVVVVGSSAGELAPRGLLRKTMKIVGEENRWPRSESNQAHPEVWNVTA
jgi:hypothetical protein